MNHLINIDQRPETEVSSDFLIESRSPSALVCKTLTIDHGLLPKSQNPLAIHIALRTYYISQSKIIRRIALSLLSPFCGKATAVSLPRAVQALIAKRTTAKSALSASRFVMVVSQTVIPIAKFFSAVMEL